MIQFLYSTILIFYISFYKMTTKKYYWNTVCPTLSIYSDEKRIGWIYMDLDWVEQEDDDRDIFADRVTECNTIEEVQTVCNDLCYRLNLD